MTLANDLVPLDMRLSADCSRSVHLALQELQALSKPPQEALLTQTQCMLLLRS